jgi:hypothetical protein
VKCPYCDSGTDTDGDLLCGSSRFEDGVIQSAACQIDVLTAQRDALLDALCRALPFVEEAKSDPANKPGVVAKLARELRAAIAQCKESQ